MSNVGHGLVVKSKPKWFVLVVSYILHKTYKWTNGFKNDHSGAQKTNRFQSGFRVQVFLRKISGLVFLIHCCNIYGNSEEFLTLLGYTLPKQKTS